MNFITQLLPGLRDVRGPLIAGYLWLFAGWVFLGGPVPDRETAADAYRPIVELGEALGRVGLVAAFSVVAYLLGSLVRAAIAFVDFVWKFLKERVRQFFYGSSGVFFLGPQSAYEALSSRPVFSLDDYRWVDGSHGTKKALGDLVHTTLGLCRESVGVSLEKAADEAELGARRARNDPDIPRVEITGVGTRERGWQMSSLTVATAAWRASSLDDSAGPLPRLSAATDLFDERSTIMTRLMETAEHAGSEVERLYAESEFRFTIAFPLAIVAVALACTSGDHWWLGLIPVAGALLAHSISLRKLAGRELVEALRSRPDRKSLDRITPVFRRYETDAETFVATIGDVDWRALGAAMQPKSETD